MRERKTQVFDCQSLTMEAQIAIKRAAEEAQEAMAELLVWQQEQNAKDAELRRQAAAERRQKAASPLREAAKPAAAPPDSNGRHGKIQWGGPKVSRAQPRVVAMP